LEVPHLTQAQIFLTHKKPADVRRAHHILDMLEGIVERTYNLRLKIDILALRALAWNAQGKTDTGLAILQQAVEAARPGGHVRVFVDLGAPMQEMLSKLAGQGIAVESINRILGAFEDSPPGFDGFQPKTAFNHLANPSAQALLEPLTPRELEIMRLLREPLSPKEIASQLGIQYSTTKRHMINIYGKLGVNSRWEAIAKAIELGILPEH
jgi:LuxR family maltose regulon positive regulatory protein